MFLLKLYHESDPERPVAAQVTDGGLTRVGRDPAVEWVVEDPEREVSRTHLELSCSDGVLTMTPLGTNGVFGDGGEQLLQGQARPLKPGDAISFGKYRMTVEAAHGGPSGKALDGTILAAPFGSDLAIPAAWPDAPLAPAENGDSLLDAFCRGADLDVSAFSGEDPAEVMRRAGEIYRQMVLGLADLMGARSTIKNDHRLERTTIGATDNNPFKWAPSRRLASDLLLRRDGGFLPGPDAIRASFGDVKKHMLGTLDGFRAAVDCVLEAGRPDAVEARVVSRKSMLQSQTAACWAEYGRLHTEFADAWRSGTAGPINDAFIAAYEARLAQQD